MNKQERATSTDGNGSGGEAARAAGKRSLSESLPVQRKASEGGDMAVAQEGFSGTPSQFPHRATIEQSFGVSLNATSYADDVAGQSSAALGAQGYAVGNQVAFASPEPSLFVAAHEAAHVVQGAGGIHRKGPGASSDVLESHADEVAAGVVRGEFVGDLLANSPTAQLGIHRLPVDGGTPDAGGAPTASHSPVDAGAPAANMSSMPDAASEAEAQSRCDEARQSCLTSLAQCLPEGEVVFSALPAGPVCTLTLASKPLNEALTDMMTAEGMAAPQISAVWTTVQQKLASSYGQMYETIGALQRVIYTMLTTAESFDASGPLMRAAATGLRAGLVTALTDALARLHLQLKAMIVRAAVDAIQGALGRTVACLEDQVKAAVDNVLPATAFGAIDMSTGTSREVRHRATTQFAAFRTALQTALQTIAGTTFQPFISGSATGMKMEMLTAADHTTRMAGAGTTIDANHLHMDGANAADTQAMAWDVYQMQATSNMGHDLVANMVAGTGQNFDIVMHAVNTSPTVSYDTFATNEVDVGDIHAEATVAAAGSTNHPQAQESVYAHFLYERHYDATHAATNMTAIAATQASLETQRLALVTEQAALPARVVTVFTGGTVTPPLTAAEVAIGNAFTAKVTAWTAARTANNAAFDARFNPAHSHGIDQENAYNRERGFDDARPH